jgi:hypothetical protein
VSINSKEKPALTATGAVAPVSLGFILQAPHQLKDLRSSSGDVACHRLSQSAGTRDITAGVL